MAMATVSSSSLHLSLRSTTLPGAQIHRQRALPQCRISSSVRRVVSKRNLLVRAADNDQSSESENRRLEELEARLGVGRKSRREAGGGVAEAPPAPKPRVPAKAWDDMSLPEKAWELYIGEKGALFWLNKLAYASIFLIIGGWIVFRFIGPALGWYELDSGLLPPSQVLSGTAGR
ncbi:hypothetical protein M758_7G126700 [Ceratodon purpureus]|uniref:Uncharacterized protein n=1 Tax=Ceratodon purpureus TaxID=3225 RepID=A0A8T0H8U2_CERPU|nr:hypothetical protein KC19_7G150500 [Ceratodon purpureus]KAG0611254.1 hypothetical protein M758_7G126700 [Ceratodon purpureus]